MSSRIIKSVANLPKVCEHINLPVQSGDDDVLQRMRRPYTISEYRDIISEIRDTIPDVTVSTDIIVGFPGETEHQYQNTLQLVEDLRFDKVHGAAYSTRPGTIAARTMDDDLPQEEKQRRLKGLETLQENILTSINSAYLGESVEVLTENRKRGSWSGRTRGNKLVYFDIDETADQTLHQDLTGRLVDVRVNRTGPWSLAGLTARPGLLV